MTDSLHRNKSKLPVAAEPYPFRIGTTSYIYPEAIIPNVVKLAPYVDDIELVLYETQTESNLPAPGDIEKLAQLAREYDLTYTVHLPLEVTLGHEQETRRSSSVKKAMKIISLSAPLQPYGFIVHLEQQSFCSVAPRDMKRWRRQCARSLNQLVECVERPQLLCVETLAYPFSEVEELVDDLKLSICLDIGHVWYYRQNFDQYCRRYLQQTRVVHLHGSDDAQDHVGLSLPPDNLLAEFMEVLATVHYQGVVTLEVFTESDLIQSMQALSEARLPASRPIASYEAVSSAKS